MILLLVQPDSLVDLPATVDAVSRYAPSTIWWAFDAKAQPQLRAVSIDELRSRAAPSRPIDEPVVQAGQVTPQGIVWSSQTSVPASLPRMVGPDVRPRGKSPPALHLSGQDFVLGEPKADAPGKDDQRRLHVRHMLSEEELEMLLAEDFASDEGAEDLS